MLTNPLLPLMGATGKAPRVLQGKTRTFRTKKYPPGMARNIPRMDDVDLPESVVPTMQGGASRGLNTRQGLTAPEQ
jgi:hypothetical protein